MAKENVIVTRESEPRKCYSFYIKQELGEKIKIAAEKEKRIISAFIRNTL